MRRGFENLNIILKALGIKLPSPLYLAYLGLCFFLMMQESKRGVGIGFLIGGTIVMAIWSHVKHRKKQE